jgi:ethanolamine permease
MIAGSVLGLGVVLIVWTASGGPSSDWVAVSAIVLNMVVFGAMLSYIAQALSFILLRRNQPGIDRPFRSPLGVAGAVITIVVALVTLAYQLQDPAFNRIVPWVLAWLATGIAYFALIGRHRLILSPEETFALQHTT